MIGRRLCNAAAAIDAAMIASTIFEGGKGKISRPARVKVMEWASVNIDTTLATRHSAERNDGAGCQVVVKISTDGNSSTRTNKM